MAKKVGFKAGQKVRIVNNAGQHHLPIGHVLTIRAKNGNYYQVLENALNFYPQDLELMEFTLEEIKKICENTENAYLSAKAKLEYMESSGVNELVDKDYRKYMVSKVLKDSKMNVDEKSRKIDVIYMDETA